MTLAVVRHVAEPKRLPWGDNPNQSWICFNKLYLRFYSAARLVMNALSAFVFAWADAK